MDDVDLTGRVVLVHKKYMVSAGQKASMDRRFLCEAGSGCKPNLIGNAIFGTWLATNEKGKISRGMVESVVESPSKL